MKLFKRKKTVVTHQEIDPNSITENVTIKNQQNQIAQQLGTIQKLQSDNKKLEKTKGQYREEEEVKSELNRQKVQIDKQNYGVGFSLKLFFKRYLKDQKFRDSLNFTTFNRSDKLGKFGDIILSQNGSIKLLDDKNNIVLQGENFNDILQSVGGLGNDVSSKMIPLNLTAEGGYLPNVWAWKPAKAYQDENGDIKYTTARREPFYKLVEGYLEEAAELREELEAKENTLIDQQKEIDELKIGMNSAIKSQEISTNEKMKLVEETSDISKIFSNQQKQLAQLQNSHVIDEDLITRLEKVNAELKTKVERGDSMTAFEDMVKKFDSVIEVIKGGAKVTENVRPSQDKH